MPKPYVDSDECRRALDGLRPADLQHRHANLYPGVMLRFLARRRTGTELRPADAAMLDRWLARLEREPVDYDPARGWSYHPEVSGRGPLLWLERTPSATRRQHELVS